ncbi:MAG: hypothetical protein M3327_13650 [Actinomycetota bacterium]|nr:hypothetical protein [Actinomycetota bacterium]
MTVEGHAYARFQRALERKNATAALSAAAELEHVGLIDALSLCLVLLDAWPERFETAALRWHGRYCRETRGVTFDEAQAVLALLGALRGPKRAAAAHALADLVDRRALLQASETLIRWASASRGAQ